MNYEIPKTKHYLPNTKHVYTLTNSIELPKLRCGIQNYAKKVKDKCNFYNRMQILTNK